METQQTIVDQLEAELSGLSGKARDRELKRRFKSGSIDLSRIRHDLGVLESKKASSEAQLESLEHIIEFIESSGDFQKPILERNQCSRLHHLKEAFADGKVILGEKLVEPTYLGEKLSNAFVVSHDWRSVLDGVNPADDEIMLPYDICVFEFRICGMTIIAWAWNDKRNQYACFAQSGKYWCALPGWESDHPIYKFIWEQIKAICVALEAEIAFHEVIRAPYKLNEKRIKRGKEPLSDYRIVDLAKRHRVANPIGGESGHKVRLHFRRGHWRHYEDYKTWVKWCLVGDPDLGFVSKHYAI